MLISDARAFQEAVGATGALIGLDPGTRTIGVAVCDERRSLTSPLETIRRGKLTHDIERLRATLHERGAKGIVIGMPYNMDGSSGPRAQSVRAFSRHIEAAFGLPVLHQDERLSSFAAGEQLVEAGANHRKRAARIDAMAAAHILQDALDEMAALGTITEGTS